MRINEDRLRTDEPGQIDRLIDKLYSGTINWISFKNRSRPDLVISWGTATTDIIPKRSTNRQTEPTEASDQRRLNATELSFQRKDHHQQQQQFHSVSPLRSTTTAPTPSSLVTTWPTGMHQKKRKDGGRIPTHWVVVVWKTVIIVEVLGLLCSLSIPWVAWQCNWRRCIMLQLLLRVLSDCMLNDHNAELRVGGENCASLKKHTMPHLNISTRWWL